MIADLDRTIRELLTTEMPMNGSLIEVNFEQPRRENSARWPPYTINFFLYDLRENNVLRQRGWEQLSAGGNGRNEVAHLKRLPMRVDCLYIVTTWAKEPEDEHRLMSRCLMTLFRYPILPKERLLGSLKNQPFDIQAQVAGHDKLANPAELWGALDNEMHPSVSYVVTLALDPWEEVLEPLVHTLTLRAGQAQGMPVQLGLSGKLISSEMNLIGGTLRNLANVREPYAGIEVAIKGTGLFAKSDETGQFTLGSIPAGEYVLVAWPPDNRPRERIISVPAGKNGDYDLEW